MSIKLQPIGFRLSISRTWAFPLRLHGLREQLTNQVVLQNWVRSFCYNNHLYFFFLRTFYEDDVFIVLHFLFFYNFFYIKKFDPRRTNFHFLGSTLERRRRSYSRWTTKVRRVGFYKTLFFLFSRLLRSHKTLLHSIAKAYKSSLHVPKVSRGFKYLLPLTALLVFRLSTLSHLRRTHTFRAGSFLRNLAHKSLFLTKTLPRASHSLKTAIKGSSGSRFGVVDIRMSRLQPFGYKKVRSVRVRGRLDLKALRRAFLGRGRAAFVQTPLYNSKFPRYFKSARRCILRHVVSSRFWRVPHFAQYKRKRGRPRFDSRSKLSVFPQRSRGLFLLPSVFFRQNYGLKRSWMLRSPAFDRNRFYKNIVFGANSSERRNVRTNLRVLSGLSIKPRGARLLTLAPRLKFWHRRYQGNFSRYSRGSLMYKRGLRRRLPTAIRYLRKISRSYARRSLIIRGWKTGLRIPRPYRARASSLQRKLLPLYFYDRFSVSRMILYKKTLFSQARVWCSFIYQLQRRLYRGRLFLTHYRPGAVGRYLCRKRLPYGYSRVRNSFLFATYYFSSVAMHHRFQQYQQSVGVRFSFMRRVSLPSPELAMEMSSLKELLTWRLANRGVYSRLWKRVSLWRDKITFLRRHQKFFVPAKTFLQDYEVTELPLSRFYYFSDFLHTVNQRAGFLSDGLWGRKRLYRRRAVSLFRRRLHMLRFQLYLSRKLCVFLGKRPVLFIQNAAEVYRISTIRQSVWSSRLANYHLDCVSRLRQEISVFREQSFHFSYTALLYAAYLFGAYHVILQWLRYYLPRIRKLSVVFSHRKLFRFLSLGFESLIAGIGGINGYLFEVVGKIDGSTRPKKFTKGGGDVVRRHDLYAAFHYYTADIRTYSGVLRIRVWVIPGYSDFILRSDTISSYKRDLTSHGYDNIL